MTRYTERDKSDRELDLSRRQVETVKERWRRANAEPPTQEQCNALGHALGLTKEGNQGKRARVLIRERFRVSLEEVTPDQEVAFALGFMEGRSFRRDHPEFFTEKETDQ